MLYEQGMKKREVDYGMLLRQYQNLTKQKQIAMDYKESLQLQINSQSDPAWVELTLMKGLGLVPEGQVKFFFIPNNP
jgi:hypothetical protein